VSELYRMIRLIHSTRWPVLILHFSALCTFVHSTDRQILTFCQPQCTVPSW